MHIQWLPKEQLQINVKQLAHEELLKQNIAFLYLSKSNETYLTCRYQTV